MTLSLVERGSLRMSVVIERVVLKNFRRFQELTLRSNSDLNILVGDNESGKSTTLLAIDLVLSGSRSRIESIGLETLFNREVVETFLESDRRIEDLPLLYVELYLNDQDSPRLNGRNNSERRECDGLRLICRPNDDFTDEIREVLADSDPVFPFEYYEIAFQTFAGYNYSGYNRPVTHLFIDSSQMNTEYATREYVKDLYFAHTEPLHRSRYQSEYRKHKRDFAERVLASLNQREALKQYEREFMLKSSGKDSLESDLTLAEQGIPLDYKGRGKQNLIKTEFALTRGANRGRQIDILLLEEPENHLSHVNMKRMIRNIQSPSDKQIFISTHSNMISARLDLRKCLLLNSTSTEVVSLADLTEDTAKFFMKAPDKNLLEFILSKKAILVEGDAEYILVEEFFRKVTGRSPEEAETHVISVGGKTFKRYLELARLLQIRTAVVTDNDGNYKANCTEYYKEFVCDHIRVFADLDDQNWTFEVSLYRTNTELCDALFGEGRRSLSVEEYMIQKKTEAAFRLLEEHGMDVEPPQYFVEAIRWISG